MEGTGRVSNSRIAWDGLGSGALSSQGSEEGAGDSDSSNVNTEVREECTVTNLVIVEFMDGRARLHVGLCHRENLLRGEINKLIPRADHRRLRCVPRTDQIPQVYPVVYSDKVSASF